MSAVFPYSREERECCLDPLTEAIRARRRAGATAIVGIQGGQGTGKSTIAAYVVDRLSREGFGIVCFSIDDFYAPCADRERLASQHPGNPFYRLPRGMPGTHGVEELLEALSRLRAGEDVDLPVFDKAALGGRGERSDRVVPVRGRQDFAVFEGWCVGMPECSAAELIEICRRQEPETMSSMLNPEHVGAVLANARPYQRLWRLMDLFVMLCPDSLLLHERWRLQQERELIARRGAGMSEEQVRSLVRHFLPFTCLCYARAKPDLRVRIDSDHRLYACEKVSAL
ncbi:MAG: hypothetical protein WCL44_01495 [bacterium]